MNAEKPHQKEGAAAWLSDTLRPVSVQTDLSEQLGYNLNLERLQNLTEQPLAFSASSPFARSKKTTEVK